MTYLAISIGAVLGANLRFLIGGWVYDRAGAEFPWATFVINVTGSFLIGLVITIITERVPEPAWVRPGLAIGFLGSFTTFSTFSYETLALVREGSWPAATGNVVGTVVACLVGVYLGVVLARA
jgi:CrcB protein